jgi:hypothetical protein
MNLHTGIYLLKIPKSSQPVCRKPAEELLEVAELLASGQSGGPGSEVGIL